MLATEKRSSLFRLFVRGEEKSLVMFLTEDSPVGMPVEQLKATDADIGINAQVSILSCTNFSLQDEPWAEFSTLQVAACIPRTYCPV
jgi:hypothetical protein